MKKSFSKAIALLVMVVAAGCITVTAARKRHTSTSHEQQVFFADPTIYAENGTYYLAGTRSGEPLGFQMLESTDLQHWKPSGSNSFILTAGTDTYGDKGFWAPQFLHYNNKYMIAYTANEQTALATAANAVNSHYSQTTVEPIDGSEHNIDPFVFVDDDGKCYLYHVRFNHGNYLWVGEFNPETGKIVDGTLQQCFSNTQPWEHTGAYESDPIMEGPTVIKLDGTYYLFYSANHFMSVDYAVGYATAPTPMGPWTKNEANPIINRSIVGEKGSGHGDVFTDNDGNLRYVYHVHYSDTQVSPRRTRIVSLKMQKNAKTGLYDITVDPSTIIIPTQTR